MRAERFARLKAGVLAGLLASAMVGFVIWLLGYTTPYKLAIAYSSIVVAGIGLIAGAQVYISNPEQTEQSDEVLAELEHLARDRAAGKNR